MKYRKKPVVIEATQWFKNGDHPQDYSDSRPGFVGSDPVMFNGDYAKARNWEGGIVRYFRRPDASGGDSECQYCGQKMNDHGWIDTVQGGHIVCPGDWIITDDRVIDPSGHGHFYPCKPDIFEATYEPVEVWPSSAENIIPPITEPMGKNWVQPRLEDIQIDGTHALMTRRVLEQLADYSCTNPTGVYPGKMWRRRKDYNDESKGWILCWYGHSDRGADYCTTNVREILLYC